MCTACHGFSVLARGGKGGTTRTVLFDVGPDTSIWFGNARRLNVDLATIDLVFLSHWHADHSGALPAVVQAIAEARAKAGRPPPVVDLHPDRPHSRGVKTPSGLVLMLPPEPTFEELDKAGGTVVQQGEPHPVPDGLFFGSGEIPRVTEYEQGLVGHLTSAAGGELEDDPLIKDERYLALCVKGRGVSVLSACSHAGIVNACLSAQEQFSNRPIDVVQGGVHLSGKAMEGRIDATVGDLQSKVKPRVVSPGHCTGWRAKYRLSEVFPKGYAPSVCFRLGPDAAK
eukprot:m.331875 g.331875  ORF g.331875 m.331875 type:complete len:284 (-) comp16514_c1_seq8:172-1023(-)